MLLAEDNSGSPEFPSFVFSSFFMDKLLLKEEGNERKEYRYKNVSITITGIGY